MKNELLGVESITEARAACSRKARDNGEPYVVQARADKQGFDVRPERNATDARVMNRILPLGWTICAACGKSKNPAENAQMEYHPQAYAEHGGLICATCADIYRD